VGDDDPNGWFATAPRNTAVLNVGVAMRIQGRNKYNGSLDPGRSKYTSTIHVEQLTGSGITDFGSLPITYTSDGGESFSPTFGGEGFTSITVNMTTTTTQFPDPNPANAMGDSDGDGIVERDEALLVSSFGGIGDPRPGMRDIVLVVGFTEPQLDIDPFTVRLLKTLFFQRSINLHVDNGTMNGKTGIGGLQGLGGSLVVPGTRISLAQATSIRDALPPTRRFAHTAIFASGTSAGWGATAITGPLGAGNVSVIDAQLEPLPPNGLNYQSGILLHELGHQLGLCHPTQHDGVTVTSTGFAPCPAIPASERDPGASAMGAPSETPGFLGAPATVANALRRPVDYTPSQWGLLNLGAGLSP
jgi:hypothetical protein